MASNWLNPVQDFLAASKSGADAGLALARIQNDKSEAAAKLAQAAQSEEDQNALGYAQLSAKKDEAGQSAAEKLQAAMAQQSALNQWRNDKLDQGQQKIDLSGANTGSLIDTRAAKLLQGDTRNDQGQQRIDNRKSAIEAANKLKEKIISDLATRHDLTDSQKLIMAGANRTLAQGHSALINPNVKEGDAQYSAATNLIAQAGAVLDSLSKKTSGTGTSAADALTQPQAVPFVIGSPSANYGLFQPSAADALNGAAGTTPAPAAAPAASATVSPTTKEEFDALPSGSLYVNPADGLTYRKK